jgi:hypothetical protein
VQAPSKSYSILGYEKVNNFTKMPLNGLKTFSHDPSILLYPKYFSKRLVKGMANFTKLLMNLTLIAMSTPTLLLQG